MMEIKLNICQHGVKYSAFERYEYTTPIRAEDVDIYVRIAIGVLDLEPYERYVFSSVKHIDRIREANIRRAIETDRLWMGMMLWNTNAVPVPRFFMNRQGQFLDTEPNANELASPLFSSFRGLNLTSKKWTASIVEQIKKGESISSIHLNPEEQVEDEIDNGESSPKKKRKKTGKKSKPKPEIPSNHAKRTGYFVKKSKESK